MGSSVEIDTPRLHAPIAVWGNHQAKKKGSSYSSDNIGHYRELRPRDAADGCRKCFVHCDLDETVTWIREAKHDFPTRYAVAASTAERINNLKATRQPRIPRRIVEKKNDSHHETADADRMIENLFTDRLCP